MSIVRVELPVIEAPPATFAPRVISSRRARARAWLAGRLTTTPGRLAAVAVLIAVGAVVFGIIASAAGRSRAHAAQAARAQSEPLLVHAANLYTALADANATATTTFLTGGLEPPALRRHYQDELRLAGQSLTALTRQVGTSDGGRTAAIAAELPVYSGVIEQARANNRQGFPVGAAYLRQASTSILTGEMLPAADQLYTTEATRLGRDYATGTATDTLLILAIAGACALALLVLAQAYLFGVSRRVFNLPLVAATAILAGVCAWAVVGLISERTALTSAQRDGSDPVEVLSATQVLFSRAQSDENLILVNRGSDEIDPKDFARVTGVLQGLMGEIETLAQRTGTQASARRLAAEFATYQAQAARVGVLEGQGRTAQAIALAQSSATASDRLTRDLKAQIDSAQAQFMHHATDATSSLSGLDLGIPLLTALAGVLALLGVRQRLEEYR